LQENYIFPFFHAQLNDSLLGIFTASKKRYQVDADFAGAAVWHDDVGVNHGGGDEVVEGRFDVPIVLCKQKIKGHF
jgi:hypothetical protein